MANKDRDLSSDYLIDAIAELKMEIKSLRADMNRVEETVLKERLRAVEDTLSQNHLLVYAGQRSQSLNQDVAMLLKEDCQNRDKCLEHYKSTIEENTQVIKQSGPKVALADLDDRIAETELMVEKTKGQQCGNCFSNFDKKLKREKRVYQEIVLVKDVSNDKIVNSSSLDIPFLLQNLFEPLGNDSRLKILSSVYEGKKSFSELSKIVDLKAGHLAFHLKKLVNTKLIAQEASKGDYIITQKGLTLVKEMLNLQK
ncbi:MAG TPA: winged helix-turn-helix domain-containing protein [Candidatus Nanoarchaeia archaeon]|nr:winged helix-turn-helix domain-containing protein [Candidatus Nanoarchaeia archaeon]